MRNQPGNVSVVIFVASALAILVGCSAHTGSAGGIATDQSDPRVAVGDRPSGDPGPSLTETNISPMTNRAPVEPPGGTGALEPAPKQSVEIGRDVGGELHRIHFGFDSYALSSEAREVLGTNAGVLGEQDNPRVVIEGHCDERGTSAYNLALGERRARSAYQYLSDLGVPSEGLDVVSFGEERPLSGGPNEEAWALNRRAEFVTRTP